MTNLTLLHTNDLHGRVAQLLRIAGLVKQIKHEVAEAGGICLYLDAGDSEDTSLLESSLTRGSAMDAMLNAATCDHVALGNAIPVRYGEQAITDLVKYLGKPILCANLQAADGSILPGLEPFRVESVGPLKIAFIGLTSPLSLYDTIFHLSIQNPLEILPGLVKTVRELGAKTVIVISHIGSPKDKELAELGLDVDIIIGGHDHKEITPPWKIGDTLIVQTGVYGRFLGRLDLKIDDETGKVIDHRGELLAVTDDLPEDSGVQEVVKQQQRRVEQMMSIPVGVLESPLDLAFTCECSAGDFLADALLERVEGAQVALSVPGHWTCGLEAGLVTQGSLYAAMRSTGNPARVEMTGSQIEQTICKALRPESAQRKIMPLRGNPVGMLHIAGIEVVDGDLSANKLSVMMNGKPIDEDGTYIVATSDLEISEYLDYCVIPPEEAEYEVPTILPEVLEDYLRRHSPMPAPKPGRIAAHLFKTA